MTDQMTTHQAAVITAQTVSFSFNIALNFLSIIIIQQAQSTWSETLKSEVSHAEHAGIKILSLLSDIKNLIKLKEISNMKLTNLIF